jgi:hypothetical protein
MDVLVLTFISPLLFKDFRYLRGYYAIGSFSLFRFSATKLVIEEMKERPENGYQLKLEKSVESSLQNEIFHRVVIWKLDNYGWGFPSLFEPFDSRQISTFFLKRRGDLEDF